MLLETQALCSNRADNCRCYMQDVDDSLWYPMQHDEVVAQDTAMALESLDITGTGVSTSGMPRAMSSDLECAQAPDDWQHYDVTEQKGQ